MWTRLKVRWLIAWGSLANRVGWPLVIRRSEYSSQMGVTVSVRASTLFTEVNVNGIRVFFRRLSGKIDGVGMTPSAD